MNEMKFTGKADIYDKYRPAYPSSLLDYLYDEVGFSPASAIADIGAGTGIFSRMLADRGSTVLCVEPNGDMLEAARSNLAGYERCRFLGMAAEDTSMGDASADFITVAQAFHWFDRERFKLECRRILKAGGKVVLVWNSRDSEDDLTVETARINARLCPEFRGFSGGSSADPAAYGDFFKDGWCDCKVFENDLVVDREGFVGRNLSGSYAPANGSPHYEAYIQAMEDLFERYSVDGEVRMKNRTRCYVGAV